MQAFTIPTKYTAIDKFSAPVKAMERANNSFANSLNASQARSERFFRKMTPGLSSATKQFLSFASAAAVAGGAVAFGGFSINSIMEYEKALASFRTIVSDLSDKDFNKFQVEIANVASATKRSTTEVANSFEKIAGLNAKFAETSEGLGMVSRSAITLARASGMELGPAAENLVGIMNQFSLAANQSNRTINVLAAGQAVGAANITQTAEAFVNFGATAAGANVSLEQSVALVQTLGKYSIFAGEAGTQLKGTLIHLQEAGLGYKSGQFQVNDALAQAKERFDKLHTAKAKDAYLTKLFGLININSGRILLNNIPLFKEFTNQVTGTGEAQKAASINSQTLSVRIDELKNRWITMITTNARVTAGLEKFKSALGFVTNNLETIVSVGINAIGFFVAWKALLLTTRAILWTYNVALGIQSAYLGYSSIAMGTNTTAIAAQSLAIGIAEAATGAWTIITTTMTGEMWALNAALAANPIGIVIAGVAALTIGIGYLIYNNRRLREEFEANLRLQMDKAHDSETSSLNRLVERYQKLGMNIKQATLAAIGFERAAIAVERIKVESQISGLQKKLTEKQVVIGGILAGGGKTTVDLPGAGSIRNEIAQKQGTAANLASQNLALAQFAQQKVSEGVVSNSEAAPKLNPKFDQNQQVISSNTTNNASATITIKNETNNSVDVAGKNRILSVQPATTSTFTPGK